jgi:hypothetical protein
VISNFIESGKANSSESVVVVVTHPMVTITTNTTEHEKAILCALMGVKPQRRRGTSHISISRQTGRMTIHTKK